MINKIGNNKSFLIDLALIISVIFCGELIIRGYTHLSIKYNNELNQPDIYNRFFGYVRRGLEYITLNIIYVVWLIRNGQSNKFSCFIDILKVTLIFIIIAFAAYPVTNDIYFYLQNGLMNLNGINPIINTAGSFTSELSKLLDWKQSSPYGPISQFIFMLAAFFCSINLILGVYIFKIFCSVLHVINAYLIWKQLKLSKKRDKITIAYLLNPLLLFEQVTNAHVDVLICTALIVFIGCLKHRHYIAAILSIWMGFMAKTLPIIWLPLFLSFLIKQQRWKILLITTFLSLTIVAVLCATVLPTVEAWKSLLNLGIEGKTAGSLHNLIGVLIDKSQLFLPNRIIPQVRRDSLSILKFITYFSFAIYYSVTLLKPYFRQRYYKENLVLDIGWITLVLFLFATPWYQPWYASILLPITALNINSQFFVITSLAFSLSSSCSYYSLGYGPEVFGLGSLIAVVPTLVMLLLKPKLLSAVANQTK